MSAQSFYVELAPDGANVARQDYSMQSATTLPLNDAPAFLAAMKVVAATHPAQALWSLSWDDKLRFARTILLAQVQAHRPLRPYQQLRYWSTVPFRHGATDVIKYSAIPRPDNPAWPLRKGDPNALQVELVRHLNEDHMMASFDFAVQVLDAERMTYWGERRDASFWIENASVNWNEAQAPFHTVARLTLLPKSRLSAEASEAVYFDVNGNATPESAPLGSINRARWPSEVASRKARMAMPRTTPVIDASGAQTISPNPTDLHPRS
jgi:hypothetical protein